MKKETEEIDNLIKQALTEEEARFYDELHEQNVLGKLQTVYRGKLGWLAVVVNLMTLVMFVGFVYSAVRFFGAEATSDLIKWASAGFLCIIAVGMLKLFIWMQMDKNDIKRELKRIELQIAALSSKIDR